MNEIFDNRYELIRIIGHGSFGEVWLATDTLTGLQVAIKKYVALDDSGIQQFITTFQQTCHLTHPNLVRTNHIAVCDRRPYIVMPFYSKGAVDSYIGKVDEAFVWRFIHDVAAGLSAIHGQHLPLVHQDIKPSNILLDDEGHFAITDFGISRQVRDTLFRATNNTDAYGSMAYMAPERFGKQRQTLTASDIWSLGASAYELATGELPFALGGGMMNAGAEIPSLSDNYSKELHKIITKCLSKNPAERPTAQSLESFVAAIMQSNALQKGNRRKRAEKADTSKTEQTHSHPTRRRTFLFIFEVLLILLLLPTGLNWYMSSYGHDEELYCFFTFFVASVCNGLVIKNKMIGVYLLPILFFLPYIYIVLFYPDWNMDIYETIFGANIFIIFGVLIYLSLLHIPVKGTSIIKSLQPQSKKLKFFSCGTIVIWFFTVFLIPTLVALSTGIHSNALERGIYILAIRLCKADDTKSSYIAFIGRDLYEDHEPQKAAIWFKREIAYFHDIRGLDYSINYMENYYAKIINVCISYNDYNLAREIYKSACDDVLLNKTKINDLILGKSDIWGAGKEKTQEILFINH